MRKIATALCLCAAMTSATPVLAQQGIVNGILGVGGAILLNELNNRNTRPQAAPRRVVDPEALARETARREQMLVVQQRLNALGFDAGTPDGIAGPRTRRAISAYQGSIGEMPTGDLSEAQTATLMQQSSGFGGGTEAMGGFPSLGSAGSGSVVAPVAFPALGTPAAGTAAPTSAFPALGVAATPAVPNSQFPALATPAAPLGTSAFPTIAAPTTPAEPTMPLVAGSAEADAATLTRTSLADEIAATDFATLEAQPAVLGVRLGDSAADFAAMLSENEFGNCTGAEAAQQCIRQTDTLVDTVKGWTADGEVWAMVRLIQFTEPVPADFVRGQFAQSYPELMAIPGGLITSGEECTIVGQRVPQLAAVLDQRQPGEVSADLLAVASQCPVAWSLAFNEGNGLVAAVQVLMLDGTSVIRQQLAAKSSRESQIGADLKF